MNMSRLRLIRFSCYASFGVGLAILTVNDCLLSPDSKPALTINAGANVLMGLSYLGVMFTLLAELIAPTKSVSRREAIFLGTFLVASLFWTFLSALRYD